MEIAHTIQRALIPKALQNSELEIAAIMIPYEDVGGITLTLLLIKHRDSG